MKSLITFKKMKGEKVKPNHSLEEPSMDCGENVLTPVTLSGVVVPWDKLVSPARNSEYKLVCTSGTEYFIVADKEWHRVLSWYSWENVKVVGLLNATNLILIPQKIFPRGPKGQKEKVIDLALWKSREAIKEITKKVNDLVLIPSAVLAVAGLETAK